MNRRIWFLFSMMFKLPLLVKLIVIVAFLLLLLLLFPVIKVVEDSMFPTYRHGQIIVGTRLFRKTHCKVGKVYILHLKDDEDGNPYYIIKRLYRVQRAIDGSVFYDFRGDNTRVSYDSRQHGLFHSSEVEARVLFSRKNVHERSSK